MKRAKELAEIILDNRRLEIAIDVIHQARAEALEEAAIKADNWLGGDGYTVAFEIAKAIRSIPNK